ncbi:hypothetical protein PSQ39_07015 [Curvibacter sp. HBC28]|uniref:Uncharacterized protein n=1 Tax=Curvibacter microcysteis TaxID=3026419 RepID=A0ABT5MCS2_9BURK|nr:hypothetical protein [Curvibacter sp. HBC28]MDD0814376.1 hypothetical protein [Curvibacter sp. HBC28]
MSNAFCAPERETSYAKWSTWDWLAWKALDQQLGGGWPRLWAYKDGWIAYNKFRIFQAARHAQISAVMLACVAHIEVGGKPDESKFPAYLLRSFDWMGPDWTDRLAVLKHPNQTSFGAISIQLRAAARELGWDADKMPFKVQVDLIQCLETDNFNLEVVAKHLRSLIEHDFPNMANSQILTDEEFIVVGARYNRGVERSLQDIRDSIKSPKDRPERQYSEYGRAMLRHRDHVLRLLTP